MEGGLPPLDKSGEDVVEGVFLLRIHLEVFVWRMYTLSQLQMDGRVLLNRERSEETMCQHQGNRLLRV